MRHNAGDPLSRKTVDVLALRTQTLVHDLQLWDLTLAYFRRAGALCQRLTRQIESDAIDLSMLTSR
jgi:hypothetical protein